LVFSSLAQNKSEGWLNDAYDVADVSISAAVAAAAEIPLPKHSRKPGFVSTAAASSLHL